MSHVFFRIKCGECSPPASIEQAGAEAIRLARKLNVAVEFSFNQVKLLAEPGSTPVAITRTYGAALRRQAALSAMQRSRNGG